MKPDHLCPQCLNLLVVCLLLPSLQVGSPAVPLSEFQLDPFDHLGCSDRTSFCNGLSGPCAVHIRALRLVCLGHGKCGVPGVAVLTIPDLHESRALPQSEQCHPSFRPGATFQDHTTFSCTCDRHVQGLELGDRKDNAAEQGVCSARESCGGPCTMLGGQCCLAGGLVCQRTHSAVWQAGQQTADHDEIELQTLRLCNCQDSSAYATFQQLSPLRI
mmetsp:Transcript_83175/g.269287  ORF Transcript_83175/g.269287 Transcript_83175/m.269287 type:complete len:216 (-) Transcript_83175:128-775(-)